MEPLTYLAVPYSHDDRASVRCRDCRDYSKLGRCLVAARGDRKDVASYYEPDRDLDRSCAFFGPKPTAADQRLGCELFPLQWKEYKARFPIAPIA